MLKSADMSTDRLKHNRLEIFRILHRQICQYYYSVKCYYEIQVSLNLQDCSSPDTGNQIETCGRSALMLFSDTNMFGQSMIPFSSLTALTYTFIPRASKPISAELNYSVIPGPGNIDFHLEVYFQLQCKSKNIAHFRTAGKRFIDLFENTLKLKFCDGYPDEVFGRMRDIGHPHEIFEKIFRLYHEEETCRSPTKFNLHVCFEHHCDHLPDDVKEIIMDHIGEGHIRYIPGQFERLGLFAMFD